MQNRLGTAETLCLQQLAKLQESYFYNGGVVTFKVLGLKYLKYFSGISLLLLLTACNTTEAPAPDYQGNWKNTLENPKLENILVIAKNGENYLITNTIKDKETGKTEKKNPMPAAVNENGMLQLNAGAGMVDFVIDEKTGNLVGSGSVYQKAK